VRGANAELEGGGRGGMEIGEEGEGVVGGRRGAAGGGVGSGERLGERVGRGGSGMWV